MVEQRIKMKVPKSEDTQKSKMVQGVFWLSAGNILSRLLGALYIIPWYAWMGKNAQVANGLFGIGYNVYALFLLISTSGIPAVIAKQIAHHNSLGEFEMSDNIFKSAIKTMLVFGIICASVMFFGASFLANLAGGGQELVPVMKSLAAAVLLFPVMSVIRGYFQGHSNMMPYALSQIVEQIARVFWMLLTVFIIMKVQHDDYVQAVVQSTFAAFIGMIGSMMVLLWFMKNCRVKFSKKHDLSVEKVKSHRLIAAIIKESIPFVISGSGIQILKLIDTWTFIRMMKPVTHDSAKHLKALFSLLSTNPDKLTMITIGMAIAISLTGLPLITENHTLKNFRKLATLVSNNFQLFLFIMLPTTLGMVVLAHPLNTIFYGGKNVLGVLLLSWSSWQSLVLAAFMLTVGVLQGLGLSKMATIYLIIGMVIKLALQFPMIALFKVYGPLLSTTIAVFLMLYLNFRKIHLETHVNVKKLVRRAILLCLLTFIMSIATLALRSILYIFLDPEQRISALIIVLLATIGGGAFYLLLALKTTIADRLLGERVKVLRKWLPF
ncbi:MAG: polysaccharide biosynthesis protein [Streptococcaceae bacterium]|jgi:O-antigen/teichoic acid export membrane protein|nr:polysaccharide biosynthesis protein [Streptococcaceae bacterium]